MARTNLKVRTVYGECMVPVELMDGSAILLAREAHVLRLPEADDERALPAGVIYIRNRDLGHRTQGEAEYQLVERGLHDALRLCQHVRIGERVEDTAMRYPLEVLRGYADQLALSRMLSDEQLQQIKQALATQAEELTEGKRAPRKVRAGVHTARAAQNVEATRDKPQTVAPKRVQLYSAARQLERRGLDAQAIGLCFNARSLVFYRRIQALESQLNEFWQWIYPDHRRSVNGHDQEFSLPTLWCAALSRQPTARSILRRHANFFRSIVAQPYTFLAQRLFGLLDDIGRGGRISAGDLSVRLVITTIRRMRMILYFEQRVVGLLAFLADRRRKLDPAVYEAESLVLNRRLRDAQDKIIGFHDLDLERYVRDGFLVMCNLARDALTRYELREALELLKQATRLLAVYGLDETQMSAPF